MKATLLSSFIFLSTLALAQSDFVYPWVTNNANFQATVILNNFGSQTAELQLTANRTPGADGTTTETITLTLVPLEQVVMAASDLFPQMGEGSGYSVRVTSTSSDLTGALVVNATATASGTSPSQADVVPIANASGFIAFNFLPLSTGFSAPVIYNAGGAETTVTYHAYQNGQEVATTTRVIAAGTPFAEGTQTLFPDLTGQLYVVAAASEPLIGLAFLFNDIQEPSMATAAGLSFLPKVEQTQETVSFSAMIVPIFERSCGGGNCHIGRSAGGLNLDPGNAFANTVNVPALQNQAVSRITPNDPDQSYLYQKLLENGEFFNSRMPRGRAPLSQEETDLILTWILEGAKDN